MQQSFISGDCSIGRYRLLFPLHQPMQGSALFYRVHLGHRERATELALNFIRKAAESERQTQSNDPFLTELGDIAERWAISHIIQGCYIQEYHEWERATKEYLRQQRTLNALNDDLDWNSGRRNFVQRVHVALEFFSTMVDQPIMDRINVARQTVNAMMPSPSMAFRLSPRASHRDTTREAVSRTADPMRRCLLARIARDGFGCCPEDTSVRLRLQTTNLAAPDQCGPEPLEPKPRANPSGNRAHTDSRLSRHRSSTNTVEAPDRGQEERR